MKEVIELSIIIVNFNTYDLTHACLAALAKTKKGTDKWEIRLIDNGSTDTSANELSGYINSEKVLKSITTVIKSPKNVGFSAGNNLGIKKARGEYVLLLNSDTEVSENAIQFVISELEKNPQAGVATCKLVLPNGEIDPACHRGFPTPWAAFTYFSGLERIFPHSSLFAQYHQGNLDLSNPHEVEAISGAFFMVKRSVIDTVGLLDEDFFMYGEDLDWAYRIHQAGFEILFLPQVSVLHKKKQSGRESQNTEIQKQTTKSFYQTMQFFYQKHYLQVYPAILTWGNTAIT